MVYALQALIKAPPCNFTQTGDAGTTEFAEHWPINLKNKTMKRVVGVGGIFFKCKDREGMEAWYRKHLGMEINQYGASFISGDEPEFLQWTLFKADTTYFAPSQKEFMINYRVADLVALEAALREEGVEIVDEIETYEYGKFLHIMDPEGNKIELWEP